MPGTKPNIELAERLTRQQPITVKVRRHEKPTVYLGTRRVAGPKPCYPEGQARLIETEPVNRAEIIRELFTVGEIEKILRVLK